MENWSKKLAKSIMERTPRLYEEKWYKGKWPYDYGVVLKGFQLLWERTQEKIYFDFIKDNIDYFVQEDGTIRGYSVEEYNIDHVNTGKLFFLLYKETGEEKYKNSFPSSWQTIHAHPKELFGIKKFILIKFGWMAYIWVLLFMLNLSRILVKKKITKMF